MTKGTGKRVASPRRVNRRVFTLSKGADGAGLPTWWPGMVVVQGRLLKAERAVEVAKEHRQLAIWLAVRHRGASVRWLARALGMKPSLLQYHLELADRLVEARGWGEVDVTRELNLAARTRPTRERLMRDEAGRRVTEAWSAPGPAHPTPMDLRVGGVTPPD